MALVPINVASIQISGIEIVTAARALQNVTFDISLATGGTLGVARGGTGVATLAVGNLLLGNGAAAMTALAPGAAGGYVRSTGTAWARASGIAAADLTGTVLDARLTTNVALKNAANVFVSQTQWMEHTSAAWAWAARITGNANPQVAIRTDGVIIWGDGTAAPDITFFRSGVLALSSNASLSLSGNLNAAGLGITSTVEGAMSVRRSNAGPLGIEVGSNHASGGAAYFDLHVIAGGDYETRIIRNIGTNGTLDFLQTGTGEARFMTGTAYTAITQGALTVEASAAITSKATIIATGQTWRGRLTMDGNLFGFLHNAYWDGAAWQRDEVLKPSFGFMEHTSNGRYEFRIAAAAAGVVTWITPLLIDQTGYVQTTGSFGINIAPTVALDVNGSGYIRTTLGVGTAPSNLYFLQLRGATAGAGTAKYAILSIPTFDATVTAAGRGYYVRLETGAAVFTMAEMSSVYVAAPVLGAGSVVTTAYGLYIESITQAGTNYSIYTGTAPSRFGGPVTAESHLQLFGITQPTNAPSGYARFWWDNAAAGGGALKVINSSGVVTTLGAAAAGGSTDASLRAMFAISGLQAWYEAEEGINASSAAVGIWDRSGNDRTSTAGSATLKAGRLSGRAGYVFDATTQGVTIAYAPGVPCTIIAVYAPNTATSSAYRLIDGSANFLIGPYNGFNTVHNSGFIVGSAVAAGVYTTIMATIDGTGTKGYEKNALISSNATTSAPGTLNFGTAGSSAAAANSTLMFCLIYNKVLSNIEANAVHKYIEDRFGLTYTVR